MSRVIQYPKMEIKVGKAQENALASQTLALVKTVLASLPDGEKNRVARELLKVIGEPDSPKAGEVLASVISLTKLRSSFSVADVKEHVEAQGGGEKKEIYNAIGYLTRKGRLRRVGYGRYEVDGVSISTSDNLGGERHPHEDLSDDDR